MRYQLSFLLAAAAAALLAACGGSGPTDPEFIVSSTAASSALRAPGSGTAASDGRTVTLNGGDGTAAAGCANAQYGFANSPCNVTASLHEPRGSYSFDWSYSTTDLAGPGADLFGVIVDGRVQVLTDPGGPQQQTGTFTVTPATSMVLFVNCTDCTGGAAQATVSNFQRR